jgi:nucleoside phosphorylase
MTYHKKILLITATGTESQAVLEIFEKATGHRAKPGGGELVYFDLGVVGGRRVFLIQTANMGAAVLGGALQTTEKGIEMLKPSTVIMVGIAFGINETKQKIGDVLVSTHLRPYDLQRMGDEIIFRDAKPDASSKLLQLCRSSYLTWQRSKVRFGVILTGAKLVDNIDYRKQLHSLEPEAIGGEMEGQGVYVACQDKKLDWILVKAICDWGDGNKNIPQKDEYQQIAATNAVSFVLHALQFTDSSPKDKLLTGSGSTLPDELSLKEIQRILVLKLGDKNQFDLDELGNLWRICIDPTVDWFVEKLRKTQQELAGDLVRKATQKGKLDYLWNALHER